MASDDGTDEDDALLREVRSLRAQVAELQRSAARHQDLVGVSLAEREELLREAERVAHLGTWSWDIQGGRVSWSDEMFRILGVDPSRILPSVEGFFAAIHPADRPRSMAVAEQALKDGVLPHVHCRIVRPDGAIRHTLTSGSYLFDQNGQPCRMVGGVLDLTEGLEVEAKLRGALALLEEAQRFAQLGSWRFEPEAGKLEWSSEFRRIVGVSPDVEPSVELFLSCLHPSDVARFSEIEKETHSHPEGVEMDGRLRRADGEIRHVRIRSAFFQQADGHAELRGTMLDITDQVRMREELAHAQKMEAVGRLAGGIAHDFNNLLTVVKGNLELLEEQVGDSAELQDSLRALTSATNLTRRLLAFGRKAQLSLKVHDPNELVHSTLSLMRRLVGDEVRLETELSSPLPSVRVDALEIERALVNLVVNARDAMPEGGTVVISSRAVSIGGVPQVELSVADEGAGIDEADRPYIFEPFYTTRAGAGGSGLGLATVLGTAEQHGGTVRVGPREGGGVVFTLVLPAVGVPAEEHKRGEGTVGARQKSGAWKVLIVDDEPMVAKVARRLLIARGHAVHVANGPTEALSLWDELGGEIELVICDVVMAEMRGPELILRLKERGAAPRVLFMSGYSEEAAHANLGHPVLAKPFSSDELEGAMRAVMR